MKKPLSPFTTTKEHYQRLIYEAKGGLDNVCIATYNVYAGIGIGGKDLAKGKPNLTRDFLNQLRKCKKVQIVVGVPRKAKSETEDEFEIRKKRLLSTAQHWPEFDWRFVLDSHLKCCIFERKKSICCISGGRNLTDSTFADVSFVTPRQAAYKIKKLFSRVFSGGQKITKRNLEV